MVGLVLHFVIVGLLSSTVSTDICKCVSLSAIMECIVLTNPRCLLILAGHQRPCGIPLIPLSLDVLYNQFLQRQSATLHDKNTTRKCAKIFLRSGLKKDSTHPILSPSIARSGRAIAAIRSTQTGRASLATSMPERKAVRSGCTPSMSSILQKQPRSSGREMCQNEQSSFNHQEYRKLWIWNVRP